MTAETAIAVAARENGWTAYRATPKETIYRRGLEERVWVRYSQTGAVTKAASNESFMTGAGKAGRVIAQLTR